MSNNPSISAERLFEFDTLPSKESARRGIISRLGDLGIAAAWTAEGGVLEIDEHQAERLYELAMSAVRVTKPDPANTVGVHSVHSLKDGKQVIALQVTYDPAEGGRACIDLPNGDIHLVERDDEGDAPDIVSRVQAGHIEPPSLHARLREWAKFKDEGERQRLRKEWPELAGILKAFLT